MGPSLWPGCCWDYLGPRSVCTCLLWGFPWPCYKGRPQAWLRGIRLWSSPSAAGGTVQGINTSLSKTIPGYIPFLVPAKGPWQDWAVVVHCKQSTVWLWIITPSQVPFSVLIPKEVGLSTCKLKAPESVILSLTGSGQVSLRWWCREHIAPATKLSCQNKPLPQRWAWI